MSYFYGFFYLLIGSSIFLYSYFGSDTTLQTIYGCILGGMSLVFGLLLCVSVSTSHHSKKRLKSKSRV